MTASVCKKEGGCEKRDITTAEGGGGSKIMKFDFYKCSVSFFRSQPEFQLG